MVLSAYAQFENFNILTLYRNYDLNFDNPYQGHIQIISVIRLVFLRMNIGWKTLFTAICILPIHSLKLRKDSLFHPAINFTDQWLDT